MDTPSLSTALARPDRCRFHRERFPGRYQIHRNLRVHTSMVLDGLMTSMIIMAIACTVLRRGKFSFA
jgi:hypothetical protein